LKEHLRRHIILFYRFSYLAYFYKYFDRKEWNVRHLQFFSVDMHVIYDVTSQQGSRNILSRQQLIILRSKLRSLCTLKHQDHSKPLKYLPVNIWSATNANTFIWLVPAVTSQKLLLIIMRSKIYSR
jgi:hypothetical protein